MFVLYDHVNILDMADPIHTRLELQAFVLGILAVVGDNLVVGIEVDILAVVVDIRDIVELDIPAFPFVVDIQDNPWGEAVVEVVAVEDVVLERCRAKQGHHQLLELKVFCLDQSLA